MTVKEYLEDCFGKVLLHIIAALAMGLFLRLTGTSGGVVLIIASIWFIGLVISLAIQYVKKRACLQSLESIMEGLDKKYLFTECIEKPGQVYEKKLFELMRRAGKSMIEEVGSVRIQQREYQEYVENWVHEIKVPITTARLICRNNKADFSGKLMPQLGQIEEHVERILYYARMGSVEKDFLISENRLDEIVAKAIAKQQTLLIQKGIRIETEGLEQMVYTDDKWVIFMLGQILVNAVRYKGDAPLIQISAHKAGDTVQMDIRDNGIGVAAHELSRIFERGFTGSNGRVRGGSTGMGLYICRNLSRSLNIQMQADSVKDEYMKITMIFPGK